jgi:hypothetical protein
LALDCLDNETAAAGVLICSDSQWALNALKESGHSAHSILSALRARLRSLVGRVCFQWVPAHCSLLGNERADEEARKAADLGPDDGAKRGRISFEVVKRLIQSQVKDGPPNHARTLRVYGDGPFRPLQGASRREEVLLAQLRGGCSLLLGETRKRVQGADSMCPRCGEEEDLEHVLRACPKLESPRRKNSVQVPRRSWLCRRIKWRWHGSSGRSSSGRPRDRLSPTRTHTEARASQTKTRAPYRGPGPLLWPRPPTDTLASRTKARAP